MISIKEAVARIRLFVEEVVGEGRKCTWPERQELYESTVVVIVSVLLLSAFVAISDKILITVLLKMWIRG